MYDSLKASLNNVDTMGEMHHRLTTMPVGQRITFWDDNNMATACVTRYEKGWTVIENLLGHGRSFYRPIPTAGYIRKLLADAK